MAKIDVYENSKFATFLSGLGWLGMGIGFYCCFEEEIGWKIGIIIVVIAVVLKMLAFFLDRFVGKIKSKRAAKKSQIKSEGDISDSVNNQERAKAQSTLDEFVKYKELFSNGKITSEEYDAKTKEIFKDYIKTE